MKVFISIDIEGCFGVLDSQECKMGNPEYERAREYMTMELEAAVRGAISGGATEIVVKDAHGSGRNIIIDNLPEQVSLIRGWSGHPFKMMQEIDSFFKAAIFIGYHSGANSAGNNLAHTINGRVIEEIRINGERASEFLINTLTASYVGVPVIFVSGDLDLIEDEVKELNLGIETLAVKKGKGGSIITMTPTRALSLMEKGVEQAVKNINEIDRLEIPARFDLEVDFTKNFYAEIASNFPNIKKVHGNTIAGTFEDYMEVLRALLFITRT